MSSASQNEQSAWLAAMQLASPALPIGGFSYSQGLEAAVAAQIVTDTHTAQKWCLDAAQVFAQCEAVVFAAQYQAWNTIDAEHLQAQNDWFFASRETAELRLETQQMGWSMVRLVSQNHWGSDALRQTLGDLNNPALPTVFAAAAVALSIPLPQALAAYGFSWAENQVAAAIKAVPLGQQAGQTVLNALRAALPELLNEAQNKATKSSNLGQQAFTIPVTAFNTINTFSPHLAILSSRHETQFTRLFRS